MSNRLIGEVKFSAKPQLAPWDGDPSESIIEIKAKILVYKHLQEKVEQVGRMKALLVRTSEAASEGFRLPIVADSYNQELCDAYCSVFDDDDYKDGLGIDCPWLDFLVLTHWRLLPLYRRSSLAVQAVRTLVATFQPEGVLIARRNIGLTRADKRELGFTDAPESDFMVMCNNKRRPAANGA